MKLKIVIGKTIFTAALIKSKTTDDFIKLLPLNLSMNDLFGREKYGELPTSISREGKRSFNYQVGDIAYWSPSHDLAIYSHRGIEMGSNRKVFTGLRTFNCIIEELK